MQRLLTSAALILSFASLTFAQEDPYAPGTVRMTPQVGLGLEPVSLVVPEKFAAVVPGDLSLNLPPGFTVRVFSANLQGPRFMAWSPAGVLHVANMKAGGAEEFSPTGSSSSQIVALPDGDGDGVADTLIVVADDLRWAHSMTFYRGDMYVADTHQIVRFSRPDEHGVFQERTVFVDDITEPNAAVHATRTIVADEINDKIYLSIGSSCDVCRESDPERAAVLEFNGDGTGRRVFARGLRNGIGLTLHPQTNELWATNNGHTEAVDSLPPEWIDIVRDGGFYGWPFAYAYQVYIDFQRTGSYRRMLPLTRADSLDVQSMQPPAALIAAHLAPMAIHFYDQEKFPHRYHNAAFVACRAGFRGPDPGHKVVALFVEPDGTGARVGDFLTGLWAQPPRRSTIWGNPVGLETDAQGALYLTSDWNNHLVLKVEFTGIDVDWEGDLPDTLATGLALEVQATVRLSRLLAGAATPRVVADLSDFDGPEALALIAQDDGTFSLETNLPTEGIAGQKRIVVQAEQETATGLRRGGVVRTVVVMPGEDLLILDDALSADWEALPSGALEPLRFATDGPVYSGDAAVSMQAVGEGSGWTLSLNPGEPVQRFGYRALAFAFHPGDVQPGPDARFSVSPRPGAVVDLIATGQVDFDEGQWQRVEIPLDPQNQDRDLSSVLFTGNIKGEFMIDDLRLVSFIQGPGETAVLEERDSKPAQFELGQSYPNPFNGQVVIPFALAQAGEVELAVYDLLGQRVAVLVEGRRAAGSHKVHWDMGAHKELASGVYFYRLHTGGGVKVGKLILLH